MKPLPILNYFFLRLENDGPAERIYYSHIAYATVVGNDICYYCITRKKDAKTSFYEYMKYFGPGPIKDSPLLARPEFMRIHNSHFINLKQVVDLILDNEVKRKIYTLISTGEKLVVSKTYKTQIERIFFPHGRKRFRRSRD